MSKPRVVHAFSAGGVVYQPVTDASNEQGGAAAVSEGVESSPGAARDYEVVLVGETISDLWVLPKGTPLAGETPEQTAVREVREETGIEPRIVGDLGSIQYWFTRKGVRFKKEVKHYLMRAVGGDIAAHDHEYAEARWFPIDEAAERLAHENEAAIVRRAAEELRKREVNFQMTS
jgi:8-oxo-dGTP pyrophosphatase MutT (NUDIX family)